MAHRQKNRGRCIVFGQSDKDLDLQATDGTQKPSNSADHTDAPKFNGRGDGPHRHCGSLANRTSTDIMALMATGDGRRYPMGPISRLPLSLTMNLKLAHNESILILMA